MEISDDLLCVFTARIEERDGTHSVNVPDQEVLVGDLEVGKTYRVAVIDPSGEPVSEDVQTDQARSRGPTSTESDVPPPPVEEGEERRVEIEDIGQQGDGIARVERGYVIIVPDTEVGDQVRIEITDVKENVAFGEVIDESVTEDQSEYTIP